MSTTDLSKEQKGRMVATLLSKKSKPGYRYDGWRWKSVPTKNVFSKEEISALTGIPVDKLEEVASEWDFYPLGGNCYLTPEQITDRLIKFANKHGRWPTLTEMKNRKKDGKMDVLPSWYSVSSWMWNRGRGYHTGIQDLIVDVPKNIRRLTPQAIMAIPNTTVRRNAMEKYGTQKLIKKAGKLIQQDDYGKLWELPTDNTTDDRSLFVEVVNSTKNEKGKFDHYFLRVKPDATTARRAVASTFEKESVNVVQAT